MGDKRIENLVPRFLRIHKARIGKHWVWGEHTNKNIEMVLIKKGKMRCVIDNIEFVAKDGDMYFIRWYDENSTYQAWLYLKGAFYQLSDDPWWNVDGDINNFAEAVWPSGEPPWEADIRLLRRVAPTIPDGEYSLDSLEVLPLLP